MKQVAKFTSADGSQTLTIVAATGKTGHNVKASIKTGKGKGQPKATVGGRSKHSNENDALEAFQLHVKQAELEGWQRAATSTRNAFVTIPPPMVTGKEGRLVKQPVKK